MYNVFINYIYIYMYLTCQKCNFRANRNLRGTIRTRSLDQFHIIQLQYKMGQDLLDIQYVQSTLYKKDWEREKGDHEDWQEKDREKDKAREEKECTAHIKESVEIFRRVCATKV